MKFLIVMFALLNGAVAFAADSLVILSPHRKSIQDEFVPLFVEYYKKTYGTEVKVDWLDQGGTSDDVRFLRAKFAANPNTSGVDIFWGGGTATFIDLEKEGMLAPYKLSANLAKELPPTAGGMNLRSDKDFWYASALSSFGIFFNKKLLAMSKIAEPKTWEDLAKPEFKGQISLTDPRKSGTATTMNSIVLQSLGWEKGWELLTEIAANTYQFTHSSSDPIKAVVSANTATSMAIDFYALAKIGDLGPEALGFQLPEGKTILDPDPVALIKGAPNKVTAERFIEFVLGSEAQKLLVLPKGQPDGPKLASLGRMAVNTQTYAATEGRRVHNVNPFNEKPAFKLDNDKAAKLKDVLNDLVGSLHVDTHKELKAAWERVVKTGVKPADVTALAAMPVTEAEALALTDKWQDEVFRNKTINSWVDFAKQKYAKVAGAH